MRISWTLCALLLTAAVARAGSADKKLDVYWIDTEGGAATLFVTPAGESVLIDAGNPKGKNDQGAVGRDATRIHKVAAEVAGLKKIDFLVTTHFHIDHFGGAAELASLMPVGTVYDNGVFEGGFERPSKDYLEFKCDKRAVLSPGDQIPVKNLDDAKAPKLAFTCVAARRKTIAPPAGAKPATAPAEPPAEQPRRKAYDGSDNANSIVQVISFGDWRMYVGGDVTWNVEETLALPVNLVGVVDVYQIPHHGLDISNNPVLVHALQPTVAVFTNGPTKGYMPESVATIKSTDSVVGIYQLHRNLRPGEEKGNLPDEFIANQAADCQGNYVRCTVEPDGKAYAVSVPATKHVQKFETKAK